MTDNYYGVAVDDCRRYLKEISEGDIIKLTCKFQDYHNCTKIQVQSFPGRGSGKYKGPEMTMYPIFKGLAGEACVIGAK